ncbi:hypothetical protein [Streptomyces profundus]|uniref:hypothetical protein n=1 Tax=Streptomyces profundus TaxID=2867410 RepID=UPI001D162807|nr:hypothetical protein [Streptomyces sp. MA3_2.13]UED85281.1 hypothetical protein K4G22_14655 [Streptomyces sp. MA3_2.13]
MGKMSAGAGVVALTCSMALLGAAPAFAETPDPRTYAPAADGLPVEGTASSADAPAIEAGNVYTDEISPGETLHYALALDSGSSAYVTTVAAPDRGSPVAFDDELRVELLTTGNESCSSGTADFDFGLGYLARPIAASAGRTVAQGAECQRAGSYLYTVTRTAGSDPEDWPIELRFSQEPTLAALPEAAPPAESWETEPPSPPTGQATRVRGGTGFNDAQPIGEGVWRDDIRAGESLVYRVPVDWGQQLALDLELGNATGGDESVSARGDVGLEIFNPAAVRVFPPGTEGYRGEQLSVSGIAPGVHYGNRFEDDIEAFGVAGWHYLMVTLGPEVGEITPDPIGLTLRLSLLGERQGGPSYESDPVEAGFGVSQDDIEQAADGLTDEEVAAQRASDDKRARGYLAIGAGAALGVGIGAWYLIGWRRAVSAAGPQP